MKSNFKHTTKTARAKFMERLQITDALVNTQKIISVDRVGPAIPVLDSDKQPVIGSDGQPLMKYVVNLQATNSRTANVPEIQALAGAGAKAEQAGDADEAHENFNTYLNKTQSSTSVITNSSLGRQIANGELGNKSKVVVDIALTEAKNGETYACEIVRVLVPEAITADENANADVFAMAIAE